MAWWAWVLCALGALFILGLIALALFRIRYRLEWRGEWSGLSSQGSSQQGTIEIRYGFPGFTRTWNPLEDDDWTFPNPFDLDDDDDVDDVKEGKPGAGSSAAPDVSSPPPERDSREREEPYFVKTAKDAPAKNNDDAGGEAAARSRATERPAPNIPPPGSPRKDPNRKRRALFRFATDADVWKFFARYGLRCLRLLFGLLGLRAEAALGHPDPVKLGRLAGKWYAVRPFLPLGDTALHFRFQDRHPTLWVRAEGGFSLLGVLGFGVRLLLAFPVIRFGFSAWKGWRQHRLTGWRAWVYRRLQTR